MELKRLRELYNQCNPEEALEPDDARNVDLDQNARDPKAIVKAELVRGARWAKDIERQIVLSGETRPIFKYFTGLRGSGKSTELLRLAWQLQDQKGANLLTVIVDALKFIDPSAEIDIPEIMTALLYETERQVLVAEKRDPATAMEEGFLTRLWGFLQRTSVELSKVELGGNAGIKAGGAKAELGVGAKLVMEMKTQPSFRASVRKALAAQLTTFLDDVRGEFDQLRQRARAQGYAGLFVIFDSLEKLQGTSSTWKDVLASAERIFAGDAPYLRLPVHVLYTIPPALTFRVNMDHLKFLPMIKIRHRDGTPFKPGFDAARAIIKQRVPDSVLKELLGPDKMKARVRRLIEQSGGYPREIVRALQSVLEIEDSSISDEAFKGLLTRLGDGYRRVVLGGGGIDFLARVAIDQNLLLNNDDDREAADRHLSNSVVLRYLNDEDWFELHPAVHDIREVRDAIERLKAERVEIKDAIERLKAERAKGSS